MTLKLKHKVPDWTEPSKLLGHGACENHSKSSTLAVCTDSADVICREAMRMLREFGFAPDMIVGIGVQMSRIEPISRGAGNPHQAHFSDSDITKWAMPFQSEAFGSVSGDRTEEVTSSSSHCLSGKLKSGDRIADTVTPISTIPEKRYASIGLCTLPTNASTSPSIMPTFSQVIYALTSGIRQLLTLHRSTRQYSQSYLVISLKN